MFQSVSHTTSDHTWFGYFTHSGTRSLCPMLRKAEVTWRRSGEQDIHTTLTDTCSFLALNLSYLKYYELRNQIDFTYAVESAYFLLIFFSHLLDRLFHTSYNPHSSQQCLYATFASALFLWTRQVVQYINYYTCDFRPYNVACIPKLWHLYNALRYALFLVTPK